MASMNIKADPTIVSAARGAAMAGVPFSMAGMYDGFVKEYGDLMDNISDNFQKNLTNINSVNSEVKEKIKELETRANDGTLPLDERQALEKEIQDYRNRLKKVKWGKKGKKERDQLEYDLNRVLADGKKQGEFATNVIDTFSDDTLYDASMVGLGPMKLIEGFVDDKNGKFNSNFRKYKNKDDEWEYSMDYEDVNGTKQTIFGTIEDMQGMLNKGKKDNAAVVDINKKIFSLRDEAKNNRNLTFDQVKNTISNDAFTIMSSSPNAYRTMISTRVAGQSQSFIESVHNPDGMMPEIMNSIIAVKPEFDKNTDGILNVEDFKDEGESDEKATKDFETFKNMLINPDAQNKDLVYRIAADFIATQEGKDAFDIGKGNRKSPLEKEIITTTDLPFSNNQVFKGGVTGGTLNNIWSMFNDGQIKLTDGDYKVDDKTNTWTNQKTGAQISGDEMLDLWQGEAGEFNLKSDVRFKDFRGSMKGGEGEDIKLPENLWGGTVTETGGVNMLKKQFPKLKDKFREGNMLSNYVVNFNGENYDLQTPDDEAKLLEAIQEYIALQP